MIRQAFRMSVHPDRHDEYVRRHSPIWPELAAVLVAHGVRTYSIFLDERTSDLFAYVEFDDEARWAAVAATDVCQRWWQSMKAIMPSNADGSPVAAPLREVFHIGGDNPAA
jgi:L-rhamnose mutarotase